MGVERDSGWGLLFFFSQIVLRLSLCFPLLMVSPMPRVLERQADPGPRGLIYTVLQMVRKTVPCMEGSLAEGSLRGFMFPQGGFEACDSPSCPLGLVGDVKTLCQFVLYRKGDWVRRVVVRFVSFADGGWVCGPRYWWFVLSPKAIPAGGRPCLSHHMRVFSPSQPRFPGFGPAHSPPFPCPHGVAWTCLDIRYVLGFL